MILTPLVHESERPKVYAEGRTCSTCTTILSRFNSGTRCAACDPLPKRATAGEQRDAFKELAAFIAGDE